MKIIHLTDVHITCPGEEIYGMDPRARLDAAVADINAFQPDAGLCMITGDLTHWGEEAAYESLREGLEALRVPWRLLIGNHDDRAAFRRVFPEAPHDPNGFIQFCEDTPRGRFIALDTNAPGTHMGTLCRDRLDWLAERLAEAPETPVYLFMHHPPFDCRLPSTDVIGLIDKQAFAEVVAPHLHRLRYLFFGHVHRPISGVWRGVPFATQYANAHQTVLEFTREDCDASHEPPTYAIVFLDEEQTTIHTHAYMDDSPRAFMGGTDWSDWRKNGSDQPGEEKAEPGRRTTGDAAQHGVR